MDERQAAGSHWADNKEVSEEQQQQQEKEEVPCHSIAVRSQSGSRGVSLLLARGGSTMAGVLTVARSVDGEE